MKRSIDRILTTHAGSLPRPEDLMELYREDAPNSKLLPRLQSAIADVARRQADTGIDIVNDGEFGKAMRRAVDFGAWWSYVYDRLAGSRLDGNCRERAGGVDDRQQGAQGIRRLLCRGRRHGRRPDRQQQFPDVRAHLHRAGQI